MNIYIIEMKFSRKALIIWSISMIVFIAMGMQEFTAFTSSGADLESFVNMFDSMPKILQNMYGLNTFDMTTAIGYYGILFPFLLIMVGIHAGMLGSNIIAKEERDKTAEYLMTKPVSRASILTSKIMAGITNIIILNLVSFSSTIIIFNNLTSESIIKELTLAAISMFVLQLLFMVIGVGLAAMSKSYKKSGGITIGILLSTYFLSLIIDMSEKLEILNLLSPFKYVDAKYALIDNKLNTNYILLVIVIITTILVLSYKKYIKRDLNI